MGISSGYLRRNYAQRRGSVLSQGIGAEFAGAHNAIFNLSFISQYTVFISFNDDYRTA